jgi:hypothetical protein
VVESNRLLIYRTIICTQGSNPCFSLIRKMMKYNLEDLTLKKKFVNLYSIIGIVAQLVRVPPCHGGSCEFESRQSRSRKNNGLELFLINFSFT